MLAACGGTNRSTTASQADYGTLVGAGVQLLRQGNAGAAEQLFQQAIAKNPHDPVAHYDLGVAYQQTGHRANALLQYRYALAADPRYVPALFNKAVILSRRNAQLAIFYYHVVIGIQPDSPTAFLNLGLLEAATKSSRAQALRDLAHAVKLEPSLLADVPVPLQAHLPKGGQ
jgi:tetratricopeptide (TPR) repeat protein